MIKSNLLPEYKNSEYLLTYDVLKYLERSKSRETFESYLTFIYKNAFDYHLTGESLYRFGDYQNVPHLYLNFFHTERFNLQILYKEFLGFAKYNSFDCVLEDGICTLTKGMTVIKIYIYSDVFQEVIENDDKEIMRIYNLPGTQFITELLEFVRRKATLSSLS